MYENKNKIILVKSVDKYWVLWYSIDKIIDVHYGRYKMKKDDVTLNDVRRYGDLLNRTDWIYGRQNHSIQDWYYQGEELRIKMVDGECIYIRILDE